MGGIKNKLNKLSNKAKTLFSNLTSPTRLGSSASGTASRRTPASRVFDDSGLRSQPVGLLSITKYASIACFTLALISTIGLNLYRTYSSGNTLSNAESVTNSSGNNNLSTLANDSSTCDPTNTNAAACISMSITSHSATGDSDNGNLSLTIPQGGGLVAGRHTVKVVTNSVSGYGFYLQSTNSDGKLDYLDQDGGIDESKYIPTKSDSPVNKPTVTIPDKTWAIALPNSDGSAGVISQGYYFSKDRYEGLVNSSDDACAVECTFGTVPSSETKVASTDNPYGLWGYRDYYIYYIVRAGNPSELPAGTYSTGVVYTVTTNPAPAPTITSVTPNTYELGGGASRQITIKGANLESAYDIYLQSQSDSTQKYDCTNIQVASDGKSLTCTVPTDQTNPDLEPGDYAIHVVTQGGEASIGFAYKEPTAWEKAVYMQDMTPEACGTVSNGESKQLIDKRDDKMYWVAKLADGNCWMTQNLNLSLSTRTALIPETSDVTNPWTPRSSTTTSISGYGPNDSDETGKSYTTNRSYEGAYDSSNPESAHYLVGTYYQYSAATAGCDLSVGGCANSICPAGWHLPSREEFQLLIDSGLSRENFNQAPYFFLRGGYLYKTNVLEGAEWGDYWSSTMQRTESPGFAYHLEVDSGGASINIRVAWNGFSVRCVAD